MDPPDVKLLVKDYYTAYAHSQKLPALRTALIQEMKRRQITDKAFEIGNLKIGYKKYEEKEGFSQKFIKAVMEKHYPEIDSDAILKTLCVERKTKTYETLRVTPLNTSAASGL